MDLLKIENLPTIVKSFSRNSPRELTQNNNSSNNNSINSSYIIKKLPYINTPLNQIIITENDDENANQKKKINLLSGFGSQKKILFKLKRKKSKKRNEYSSFRKRRILRLEELEANKIKKITERNEEYKKLNEDQKNILLEFEKEKKNYQYEISNIRKQIKETLEDYEKLKLEKEKEIENLNIEILKKKTQIFSFKGLETQIENINKESLSYEDIIKDVCFFGNFIKNEIYKFKFNEDKLDEDAESIKNNRKLEILLDMLRTKGINDELKENYKDKNLPYFIFEYLLLDNFVGEKSSFKFSLSKHKCEQIKTVLKEQIKFTNYIKTLINSNFKIPKEKIIVNNFRGEPNEVWCDVYFTNNKIEDYHIQFFNNIYKLINIKENFIKKEFMQYGKNFRDEFDETLDNVDGGWGEESKIIGGKEYDPPKGYIGIGLNVNKFGNDKTWLGTCNAEGEWPIAYHGVGGHLVYNKARSIIKNNLIPGGGNSFGDGVYFGREIRIADEYAKYSQDSVKYYVVFMCRVNPNKLKIVKRYPEYWLLPGNGNGDFIRPYRILLREVE